MKIKKQTYFARKFRNLFWVLFLKIENNNNANFKTNGEAYFLKSLIRLNSKNLVFGANTGKYTSM